MKDPNEVPNYYAIIPANVRYDDELKPNEKLLYGEITALSQRDGKCWATNSYFAKLYGVSTVCVSWWIRKLKEKGYIDSVIIHKEGSKQILYRYLTLIGEGIKEKFNTPIKEKFKDNNTRVNNTRVIKNNTTNVVLQKEKFWEFKNVLLSPSEKNTLLKKYWNKNTKNYTEQLSCYLEQTGKKYKSHYATILNWMRRDKIQPILDTWPWF